MPGLVANGDQTKKRKRVENAPTKRRVAKRVDAEDEKDKILSLESQIFAKEPRYENIEKLYKLTRPAKADSKHYDRALVAAVALCRVFCRIIAAEGMIKSKVMDLKELEQAEWLKTQWRLFVKRLCAMVEATNESPMSTALTLLMRLVKEETSQEGQRGEQAWRTGAFPELVRALAASLGDAGRTEFVEKYVGDHDDIRFFTFHAVARLLSSETEKDVTDTVLPSGCISMMSQIEGIPSSEEDVTEWYGKAPRANSQVLQLNAHRKQAQEAWIAVLSSSLTKQDRKTVLGVFTDRVAPWFTRPETLMDFLTDSYNEGGATSLLALSGLFYLIRERNLDYPQFYTKLYSLLDEDILHSKHRSRFFRLLDTFMASSHLPGALVASFIKRLSRLALHGPPGGIVVVVPWVYNMLKRHPTCTFMIHRELRDESSRRKVEEEGMDDSFDMEQSDPMTTGAMNSSLWELETLQSHYHPNVATLARIISEQFTKREYSLEDFLDHSYQGIIAAELGKEIQKPPVVEYEIPKRIITTESGGLNTFGVILKQAIETV